MFRSMARMYLWFLLKVSSCGLRPPTTEDSPSPISSTMPRAISPARLEDTEDLLIPSCFARMVLDVTSLLKILSSTARLLILRTRDISTDSGFFISAPLPLRRAQLCSECISTYLYYNLFSQYCQDILVHFQAVTKIYLFNPSKINIVDFNAKLTVFTLHGISVDNGGPVFG